MSARWFLFGFAAALLFSLARNAAVIITHEFERRGCGSSRGRDYCQPLFPYLAPFRSA